MRYWLLIVCLLITACTPIVVQPTAPAPLIPPTSAPAAPSAATVPSVTSDPAVHG